MLGAPRPRHQPYFLGPAVSFSAGFPVYDARRAPAEGGKQPQNTRKRIERMRKSSPSAKARRW